MRDGRRSTGKTPHATSPPVPLGKASRCVPHDAALPRLGGILPPNEVSEKSEEEHGTQGLISEVCSRIRFGLVVSTVFPQHKNSRWHDPPPGSLQWAFDNSLGPIAPTFTHEVIILSQIRAQKGCPSQRNRIERKVHFVFASCLLCLVIRWFYF
jgi:hypothetical protein